MAHPRMQESKTDIQPTINLCTILDFDLTITSVHVHNAISQFIRGTMDAVKQAISEAKMTSDEANKYHFLTQDPAAWSPEQIDYIWRGAGIVFQAIVNDLLRL